MSDQIRERLTGTTVKRTSDDREYTLQVDHLNRLTLHRVDDNGAEITVAPGHLRLSLKGGTYYLPAVDSLDDFMADLEKLETHAD